MKAKTLLGLLFALLLCILAGIIILIILEFYFCTQSNSDRWGVHQPQQVHLSIGSHPASLLVTWSTINITQSIVLLIHDQGIVEYSGYSKLHVNQGRERRRQYVHRVEVGGLMFETSYRYRLGSPLGWSNIFHIKTSPQGSKWPLGLILFGDLGVKGGLSLSMIQREVEKDHVHGVIHIGDFAYDMDMDNGRAGDAFMNQIEPIASIVPYMTCPGNHENMHNFSQYKARFSMPRDNGNLFYSFNMGPVHFISINTEYYYFPKYGHKQIETQYRWLNKDLAQANLPKARLSRPWLVLFGHRPMYCSTNDQDCDRSVSETLTRIGLFGMEDLLARHKVDLAVWAHNHNYERMWPIYNLTVLNGTEAPYINPRATVHVTTGSAGSPERHDKFRETIPVWTAFRSTNYGYTKLSVKNHTHLNIQQVSADRNGEIIDNFWIVKTKNKNKSFA